MPQLRVISVKNSTPQTGGQDLWGIYDADAGCFVNADGRHVSGFAAQLFPTEAEAASAVSLLLPDTYEKPFCGCDAPYFCHCDSRKFQTARGA